MRRTDNEPLLFDLPLDRPARHDDAPEEADSPTQRTSRPTRDVREGRDANKQGTRSGGKNRDRQTAGQTASREARSAAMPAAATGGVGGTGGGVDRRRAATSTDLPRLAAQADAFAGLRQVTVGRRAAAGGADLLVHLAVLILVIGACRYLGVLPAWHDWPALLVFLLTFSFLYTVVPLAFWGHTLGMSWAGLTAESTDGEPLSFDQTARRWIGALLTLAVVGLPLLIALGGRSLADRLSESRTLLAAGTSH